MQHPVLFMAADFDVQCKVDDIKKTVEVRDRCWGMWHTRRNGGNWKRIPPPRQAWTLPTDRSIREVVTQAKRLTLASSKKWGLTGSRS